MQMRQNKKIRENSINIAWIQEGDVVVKKYYEFYHLMAFDMMIIRTLQSFPNHLLNQIFISSKDHKTERLFKLKIMFEPIHNFRLINIVLLV